MSQIEQAEKVMAKLSLEIDGIVFDDVDFDLGEPYGFASDEEHLELIKGLVSTAVKFSENFDYDYQKRLWTAYHMRGAQ